MYFTKLSKCNWSSLRIVLLQGEIALTMLWVAYDRVENYLIIKAPTAQCIKISFCLEMMRLQNQQHWTTSTPRFG